MKAQEAVRLAWQHHTIVPAFNIPYLPMAKPVAQAIIDEKTVAMLQVARLEWEKFEAQSLEAVAEEYFKYYDPKYTLLHLDHVPVIDEDQKRVDYMPILERAVKAGYQSVMVDGSRLKLAENIAVTKQVADFAHANDIACEAELGSVMGHEGAGANMDYEEIFRTKKGFTDLGEAKQFAEETKCDWLSVAVGSIHGAIAEGVRNQKKPEARLDIQHIADLSKVTNIPLVLHGGSGINNQCILDGIANGIAKINVGTGYVQCAHGLFPVPAPAVAEILRGEPYFMGPGRGELCTPTGAAIVKTMADEFGRMPVMEVESVGYGAGVREMDTLNALRVFIGHDTKKA